MFKTCCHYHIAIECGDSVAVAIFDKYANKSVKNNLPRYGTNLANFGCPRKSFRIKNVVVTEGCYTLV